MTLDQRPSGFLEAMAESGEAWSVPPVVVTFFAGSQKEASYNIDKKIYDRECKYAS